jgi:hypothetical protein
MSAGIAQAATPHWVAEKGIPGNSLLSVSCPSKSDCIAVGVDGTNLSGPPRIMRWNGHKWRTAHVAYPSGAYIDSVSCASTRLCMVVGYAGTTGVAYVSHGGAWTSVSGAGAYLGSVSCPSTKSCWAVGSFNGVPVADHWTGGAFAAVRAATVGSQDELEAVSCTTRMCIAVGQNSKGGLYERSTGGAFTRVRGGKTERGHAANMMAVSCVSSSFCMATGEQDSTNGDYKTLTEVYHHGHFTTVASPNPTHFSYNTLLGVSCLTAKDCWAAGEGGLFGFGGPGPFSAKDRSTIALQWNGRHWKHAKSANPGNKPTEFQDVSCATAKACVAVGGNLAQSPNHSIVERLVG